MATIQDIIIQPATCVNLNQSVKTFCLPNRIQCKIQSKEGRFVECGEEWVCNLPCARDRIYYQPFISGDLIQFQTVFFSGSQSNPTPYDDLLQVELCTVSGTIPLVAKKTSGWKDNKPFQIIEVDTTNINECFSLKVTNLNTGKECCTQHFGPKEECIETITIQSKRTSEDCFGYCYGEADSSVGDDIEYNNELRFCGFIKRSSSSNTIEKSDFSNQVSSEEIRKSFKVVLTDKLPPYVENILCNQLLTGGLICINGEEYYSDGFQITEEQRFGSMLANFSFEVYQECSDKDKNCL